MRSSRWRIYHAATGDSRVVNSKSEPTEWPGGDPIDASRTVKIGDVGSAHSIPMVSDDGGEWEIYVTDQGQVRARRAP